MLKGSLTYAGKMKFCSNSFLLWSGLTAEQVGEPVVAVPKGMVQTAAHCAPARSSLSSQLCQSTTGVHKSPAILTLSTTAPLSLEVRGDNPANKSIGFNKYLLRFTNYQTELRHLFIVYGCCHYCSFFCPLFLMKADVLVPGRLLIKTIFTVSFVNYNEHFILCQCYCY